MGELVVGDDNVFVNESGAVDVVDEPVEYCLIAHFEERFGEVLGEWIEPRGIAGGKDEAFHEKLKIVKVGKWKRYW